MTDWIVAESLERLRAQLDAAAPTRSKASDGSIGDTDHASRSSDHNPWYGPGIVTARDFTHDPAGGLNCARLAAALQQARDSRVKYVIWDRRIMAGAAGPAAWTWRPYSGANPHTKHLHLSVVADRRARDGSPWMLPDLTGGAAPAGVYCRQGDRGDRVLHLQKFMTAVFASYNPYRPTGFYGLATRDGVAEFQRRTGITGPDADGTIVGPRTLTELRAHGFTP